MNQLTTREQLQAWAPRVVDLLDTYKAAVDLRTITAADLPGPWTFGHQATALYPGIEDSRRLFWLTHQAAADMLQGITTNIHRRDRHAARAADPISGALGGLINSLDSSCF